MASDLQAKAIFLVLLIAGHEAVRVREAIHVHNAMHNPRKAAEDEWQKENNVCTWSTFDSDPGCKGPGCKYRYLPWDKPVPFSSESCRRTDDYMLNNNRAHYFQLQAELLAAKSAKFAEKCSDASALNLKCSRRAKHVYRAMKFLGKAQDSSLIESLTPEEKAKDKALFEESLNHMAGMAGPDGELVQELTRKMKLRTTFVKEDPLKAVKEVVNILTCLLKGSNEEKERARKAIREMEEVDEDDVLNEPMKGEDLRDYVSKLEKGAPDVIESMDMAALDLDSDSRNGQLETNGNITSLLQLSRDDTDVKVVKGIAFVVICVLVVAAIIWAVIEIVAILVAWAFISILGCSAYALGHNHAVSKGQSNTPKLGAWDAVKCMGSVFAMPFVYVYRGGRWMYRLISGKKQISNNATAN
mmetsp:Transcript_50318/g.79872  ORF Transcript_50318/g.79872 Transcript_50318/m.79872 type:complete len:414 (-) Transcript_50318:76-1317(-)